jgi:hypothetical protein
MFQILHQANLQLFFFFLASEGIKNFEFHGILKSGKDGTELRKFDAFPTLSEDGQWWAHSDDDVKVSVGDVISYWLFFSHNSLGYRYDDQTYEITSELFERRGSERPSLIFAQFYRACTAQHEVLVGSQFGG